MTIVCVSLRLTSYANSVICVFTAAVVDSLADAYNVRYGARSIKHEVGVVACFDHMYTHRVIAVFDYQARNCGLCD